jgi:adenosylcobinamide amidohydrolase
MKKTTPKTTKLSLISDLPIIKIVSEEEEMHVKMELEMEDTTHDMLVKWGKEVATDEDYVRIAIDAGIREAVDALNNKQ